MTIARVLQQAQLAFSYIPYVRSPLNVKLAKERLRVRVENRSLRFLQSAEKLIYNNPRSPFRKLLLLAGCEYPDLVSAVQRHGLETALENLRDAGVYLTSAECRGKNMVRRGNLEFDIEPPDMDNPYLMGRSISARTSGSSGKAVRVLYDWDFFAEEADNEILLLEEHGMRNVPSAFWLPASPSISGVHNLFIHLKFHAPPSAWFSHLLCDSRGLAMLRYISIINRLFRLRTPIPVYAPMDEAVRIARWIQDRIFQSGACSVKAFSSSAIRVVQAANESGIQIGGCVFYCGGEPLSKRGREYIEAAGAKAVPRYVTTETGLVGAYCGEGNCESMHLYTDRLAVIRGAAMQGITPLLFTTISDTSGKILLNTDLGDCGDISTAHCSCLFAKTGMNTFLSHVRSHDKLTGEGMSLMVSDLREVIEDLVARAGGNPNDFQFWEEPAQNGLTKRIQIAVHPRLANLDDSVFIREVLERMRRISIGARVASDFWRQSGTLEILRTEPQVSQGFKQPAIISRVEQ